MKEKGFDRFSFVDEVSMEIIITYNNEDYIRGKVKKFIKWIIRNCKVGVGTKNRRARFA